ncbi:hypothetical protein ACHHYP_03008 [Achlya hypogyna]|uniref:Potassium channel domain-containing protein n=1 Tax=Achlya hypogyna TaxID=1202772 RepID=A0A1V9Z582_ACHHY|nr:hypothetical protein ACHHYP_03008 [Achlya hypogyna]
MAGEEVGKPFASLAASSVVKYLAADFIQQLQLDALVRKANNKPLASEYSIEKVHLSDIEARIGRVALDPLYRSKNLWILVNGMFGLALSLVELVVTWENSSCVVDADLGMVPLTTPPASNMIKIVLSISSVLLALQLGSLYRAFLHEQHQWEIKFRRRVQAAHSQSERWFSQVCRFQPLYSIDWSLLWKGGVEIGIALIHPPPFAEEYVYQSASCLMFLRLYLLARVYRDHSKVYRRRQAIVEHCFLDTTSPPFDWFLSVKIDFGEAPLQFIVALYLFVLGTLSVSVHVFERVYQPDVFCLPNAIWFAFCTLTTHGLPDMTPISANGRFVTAVMLVLGIALETMVVVAILHNFGLNDKGRLVSQYLQRLLTNGRLRKVAGRALWSWWRWKRARHKSPSEESATRFKFWRSLEPLGNAKEEAHLLLQSVGDPVLDQLARLEATAARLRSVIDKGVPACSCDTEDCPDTLAAALQTLRENQAVLEAQSQEIALLFAHVMSAPATGRS